MSNKKKLFVPEPIPEWFQIMKERSLLTARDIAILFEYGNEKAVANAVSKLRFIKADKSGTEVNAEVAKNRGFNRIRMNKNMGYSNKNYWYKSTIMKELERRKQHNLELTNEK